MAINNIAKRRHIEIVLALTDSFSISFSEDDIIRCVLSLRGDLSIENPTLPESEFEAEIYWDTFTSEMAADLPDETSVTYKCSFPTNGSSVSWGPVRYFYTDKVEWNNNILKIHARDQVHKLDEELPAIYIGQRWCGLENQANSRSLIYLLYAVCDALNGVAQGGWLVGDVIEHLSFPGLSNYEGTYAVGDNCDVIMERMTRREFIAKMMNLCRFEFESGFLSGNRTDFKLDYVDAGIPRLTTYRPSYSYFGVYEEDCGNITESRPKNVAQYNFKVRDIWASSNESAQYSFGENTVMDGASASVIAASGMSLSYRNYSDWWQPGFDFKPTPSKPEFGFFGLWWYDFHDSYFYRARPYQASIDVSNISQLRQYRYGYWLFDNDAQTNPFNFARFDYIDFGNGVWNTPMGGDERSPAQRWQKFIDYDLIESDTTNTTLQMSGYYYDLTNERKLSYSTGTNGTVVEPSDVMWNGAVYVVGQDNIQRKKVLPDMALQNLAKRSQVGGSFTHRGEPNWQPRDYFRFYFMEKSITQENEYELTDENDNILVLGGYEYRTVETITTTHEKGGTVSEITYKKGKI